MEEAAHRTAEEEEAIREEEEEVAKAPEEPRESVRKVLGYIGKPVRVTMSDGRLLTGAIICFDKRMNVLLDNVTEERPVALPNGKTVYDTVRLSSCIISKKYWTKIEYIREHPAESERTEAEETQA